MGGLVIVAGVGLSHRSSHDKGTGGTGAICGERGVTTFCDAASGLLSALHNPLLRMDRANFLPPTETPGATNPAVTQANINRTICQPGYARSARPSYAITGPFKRRLMEAEHPGERPAEFELDHLIPISLGGAPFDRRDLWLQPRFGQANAGEKNALAYVLWRLVCERRLSLGAAQRAISSDWTRAYARYATPENIAKYHFRHDDVDED